MSLLFLVRHGQAAPWGVLAGRADYPLSPQGVGQMQELRDRLAGHIFSVAWCSPLARARQSAEIILSGNPANTGEIIQVPALTEISLGLWDGKDKEWIQKQYPQEWEARGREPAAIAPPGGESFAELALRVLPAFAGLCDEARNHTCSLLVAHQAVNRVILARVSGRPLTDWPNIRQPLAAVSVLDLTGATVRLLK